MILTDSLGKKVNVTRFSIELVRGFAPNEAGNPTLVLLGKHMYLKNDEYGQTSMQNKCAVLHRCPCNQENINLLLERKDQLEELCEDISERMHNELGEMSIDNRIGAEIDWLVAHGFRFYEEDEYHFSFQKQELCKEEPEP